MKIMLFYVTPENKKQKANKVTTALHKKYIHKGSKEERRYKSLKTSHHLFIEHKRHNKT